MTASARISGAWKSGAFYGRVGGAWKLLTPSARVGGAWKAVGGGGTPLSVTLDSTSIYNSRTPPTTDPIGSDVCTATPAGGTAPYTYAWTQDSGAAFTIANPTAAATNFIFTPSFPLPITHTGLMRCTVTDANGAVAYALVYVNLEQYGGS